MKNYIFLTPSISVIGGAELYCARRAKYLANKGFRVVFISGEKNTSDFLPDFKPYEKIAIEEMPLFFSGTSSILFKIIFSKISELKLSGDTYIESHSVNCFLWGEALSSILNSKHIFYILAEFDLNKYKYYKELLRFGLFDGKLIGLSNQSLKICFPHEKNTSKFKNYVNISFSKNELALESNNFNLNNILQNKVDFRVLTVSRLEKTYIEILILSCIELSKKHIDHKIELIVIGDTKNGAEKERLVNKYKSFKNFTIEFLGYINPIPINIFKESNIFVGMGTAAINSVSIGCPTIIVDPTNNLNPGYFGDELSNFAFSETGNYIPLLELMDRGFKDRKYLAEIGEKSIEIFKNEFDFFKSMEKLDYFFRILNERVIVDYVKKQSRRHKILELMWRYSLVKYYNIFRRIIKKKKFLKI